MTPPMRPSALKFPGVSSPLPHWGHKYKDFVAKLVDYLPDTEATIASLCQENDIDVATFYRLQIIPENPSQDDLFQLYMFMGELGHK